jgi:HPt (histidine-containing phosphotransfer) domain-containing protein
MFITVKRHEREKQVLLGVSNRLIEAVLKHVDQGLFMLDASGNLLPTQSQSLPAMFRRRDLVNLTFEKLLIPVVSPKTLTVGRAFITALLAAPRDAPQPDNPLTCVDMRLANADGTFENALYSFQFDSIAAPDEPPYWLVRVTDITSQTQLTREVEDLRSQIQTQGEILRGVLQMGGARLGAFVQKAEESLQTINAILKKPARAAEAFRSKIEEILDEVDRIRRDAAAFKLSALVNYARVFEDALHDLRGRSELSGSDFLPVAVKMDQLYTQFALVKSLAAAAAPVRDPEAAAAVQNVTENGTLILSMPKPPAEPADGKVASAAPRAASAGSLDGALQSLTEHVALEQQKQVVLDSQGLNLVPSKFQAAVKNVAIQLIRNAVVHGIEPAAEREAAGKPACGNLRLQFKTKSDGYQLLFEDDGRGIDPHQVRATAIARGVSTPEAAARMRDREAIKLIFKSRYTTLAESTTDNRHGAGMSLVRRYVHESGGKIALASLPGRDTRFKIILPPLLAGGAAAALAAPPPPSPEDVQAAAEALIDAEPLLKAEAEADAAATAAAARAIDGADNDGADIADAGEPPLDCAADPHVATDVASDPHAVTVVLPVAEPRVA